VGVCFVQVCNKLKIAYFIPFIYKHGDISIPQPLVLSIILDTLRENTHPIPLLVLSILHHVDFLYIHFITDITVICTKLLKPTSLVCYYVFEVTCHLCKFEFYQI
jgi:hypothetical protein